MTRVSGSWGGDPATAAELATSDAIRVVGAACSVVAAVLLINLARRLAARQALLSRAGPSTATSTAPPPLPGSWPGSG